MVARLDAKSADEIAERSSPEFARPAELCERFSGPSRNCEFTRAPSAKSFRVSVHGAFTTNRSWCFQTQKCRDDGLRRRRMPMSSDPIRVVARSACKRSMARREDLRLRHNSGAKGIRKLVPRFRTSRPVLCRTVCTLAIAGGGKRVRVLRGIRSTKRTLARWAKGGGMLRIGPSAVSPKW